jgi:cytochrome P450
VFSSSSLSPFFLLYSLIATANTLSFAFVALALNPTIQDKAREEIRHLETEGIQITYKKINHLPYCWAIFRETLRLFPTVPLTPRMVESDYVYNGYTIPKGCRILVNNLAVCRSEKYFKTPLDFIPERWGTDDKELRNYEMTRNFGGGMRLCIGKRFAEEETILLLAMILSKFKISLREINGAEVKDPTKIGLTEIPTVANVTLSFEHSFGLMFEPIKD